jgi:NADH dehydrogenase FAD-containing subunit
VKQSNGILIVGRGAVEEIALDVKSLYPKKNRLLVHSRDRLLNNFKPKLSEAALEATNEYGVKVYLGQCVIADNIAREEDTKQAQLSSGETSRMTC